MEEKLKKAESFNDQLEQEVQDLKKSEDTQRQNYKSISRTYFCY